MKSPILKVILVSAVSILLIGIVGAAVYSVLIMESQKNVNTLQEQVAIENERKRQLEVDLEEVKDPEFILEQAERLGMITPPTIVYIPNITDGITSAP